MYKLILAYEETYLFFSSSFLSVYRDFIQIGTVQSGTLPCTWWFLTIGSV